MIISCITCDVKWSDGDYLTDHRKAHSYCLPCIHSRMKFTFQSMQINLGHKDCYASKQGCVEKDCRFRRSCQDTEINKWRKTIVS